MAECEAIIRRYNPATDDKLFCFVVGKANMELLAIANRKVYASPWALSIWIGLSTAMIGCMGWMPTRSSGWLAYLTPLPCVSALAVAIMFLVDWKNRPYFDELTMAALRGPDMSRPEEYYSKHLASGLWILDFGARFVGLIALCVTANAASKTFTAHIRHFYVDEVYRGTEVQDDLLHHAVSHAFSAEPKLETIYANDPSLLLYIRTALRKAGFRPSDEGTEKMVGLLRWSMGMCALDRKDWRPRVKQDC